MTKIGKGKGRAAQPKRMNFRKSSKGGGVSFSIQKFMLQSFAIIDDTSVMNFGKKKLQHYFPKMRGGGQRPFGIFPKIHPFWLGDTSHSVSTDLIDVTLVSDDT